MGEEVGEEGEEEGGGGGHVLEGLGVNKGLNDLHGLVSSVQTVLLAMALAPATRKVL